MLSGGYNPHFFSFKNQIWVSIPEPRHEGGLGFGNLAAADLIEILIPPSLVTVNPPSSEI